MNHKGAIGVFDSGYGGLTILKSIVSKLPQYDYLYLGDNARAPYGNLSYETVYQYTLEAVDWFFKQGCSLIILACNTASAKALRTIQQNDLAAYGTDKRVLGVIRPTAEIVGNYTHTNIIGVLGTLGTIKSDSYRIEINKFFPQVKVYQQACPMWVPLIENGEHESTGADFFVSEYLQALFVQSSAIDTILLGCTHYPLLKHKIQAQLPVNITIIDQSDIVANSLKDYLLRHSELERKCCKDGTINFYTSDNTETFNKLAKAFYGTQVTSLRAFL